MMSDRLQKLLDVFEWYDQGYAPSKNRFEEHCELLCVVHDMEKHTDYQLGLTKNWPTTVDASWIRAEVITMKAACASLMVHAPAHDQYRLMAESVENKEEELMQSPAPMLSYLGRRTWLRSAG
jgi:hypothetical protein